MATKIRIQMKNEPFLLVSTMIIATVSHDCDSLMPEAHYEFATALNHKEYFSGICTAR